MTTKYMKKRSALPRSRSKMTMSRLMPHMMKRGSSMRKRGMRNGPTRCAVTESASRLEAR